MSGHGGGRPSWRDHVWSIVLAGGEGERLRSFTTERFGRHVPKQYCTFTGRRSMFQHTLDRAATLSGSERVLAVVASHHADIARSQTAAHPARLILQPANRETAAGIFLPLTHVVAVDPDAVVVVFPSDHFVHPEDRFVDVVAAAAGSAELLSDHLVLLGARPTGLELEYGWIHVGRELGSLGGHTIRRVRSFFEKPGESVARVALDDGGLWNTLVMAGRARTFWEMGHRCLPDLMPAFERLSRAIGSSREATVLEQIYRRLPSRNFSSGLLQRVRDTLAVIELRGVLWSDWGHPARIAETLAAVGVRRAPAEVA